ncbi:alpha/beta fold hydrolase [[Kitasatospora] papulosa]|uniref:alpha/beta fold hydrolase n=1 Tax=[Kitasatospora] papulosa TaxID=1464011 RepID=UPI003695E72E
MSNRPVPHEVTDEWFRPLWTSAAVRRDLRAYVLGVPPRGQLRSWIAALRTFDRSAPVVRAAEEKVVPPAHGRRPADQLPRRELVEIADSCTLIPEDQPERLAEAVKAFVPLP